MILDFFKRTQWFQNLAVRILAQAHPLVEHNVSKIEMLKKAFFYCDLEGLPGSYFEFGIYEGTSLYAAAMINRGLKSPIKRNLYGFDSFEGFKYFDPKDKHPFYLEDTFHSSYEKTKRRLAAFPNVKLIKGYIEDVTTKHTRQELCGDDLCAIVFIDCDLMSPAHRALEFLRPILQEGSVIILDDYWNYKGSMEHGTAGALQRFLKENPGMILREYLNYGCGGKSFIIEKLPPLQSK